MQILETHTSKTQELPIRFQEYGVAIFKTITTKSALKKAIKKKQIYIDGILATTSKFILGGEQIDLVKTKENRFQKKLAFQVVLKSKKFNTPSQALCQTQLLKSPKKIQGTDALQDRSIRAVYRKELKFVCKKLLCKSKKQFTSNYNTNLT